MPARHSIARIGTLAALLALGSCGGGGGGGEVPQADASCNFRAAEFVGVCTGFPDTGNLDWQAGGDGGGGAGDGGGASGDGGVGAGGDFGQFRNVTISVFKEDGTLLGSALTDNVKGMVTIRPGASYRGSLRVELRGGPGAEYFEEGKNAFVPFPTDRVIRVIVPRVDKNIGITPFTEAAYQLLTQGTAPESVATAPTPAQIAAANRRVAQLLNDHFPKALEVNDITRLPFIKSASVAQGSLTPTARGVYGVVNGAFSKQAALFNTSSATPTLDATAQLAEDLRDGTLDGRNGNAPSATAAKRTYDPQTLTGELTAALAQQAERFGNQAIKDSLPAWVNYGGTRYKGYLFDTSVPRGRVAVSTVAGWLAGNALNLSVGQALPKVLPAGQSVATMFSNFGHGGAFFKIDSTDTTVAPVYRVYALGDNVNGELGTGNQNDTDRALVEITLPGPLTHAAGGFAHTVLRLGDGRVFTMGDNSFGQLGQGVDSDTLQRSTTPVQVALPASAGGAVAVAATSVASYALMADGSVYAWGSNGGFGLLGGGQAAGMQTSAVLVAGVSDVVQITARDNDVAVLKRDQTLWQWGSHPADANAYTDGDVSGAYRGGTFVPTAVAGLPTTTVGGRQVPVPVRKIIAEQGLFAALLSNGHVYTWGVHFDLSAKAVLRDLSAARVLGLPPVRDMMPGGFVGYGARPFDRLTSVAVDYSGGMWKIRGRVAELLDPANPTAQRRPQTGEPRSANCASCHTFLDQTMETLRARQLVEAPVAAGAAVCAPIPPTIHAASDGTSFIRAETECISCHNPARLDAAYAGQLPPSFVASGGWPNCNKPTNLPSRNSVAATPISTVCTVPVGHAFTPPGTVCSTCHNSVVARALQNLAPPCLQPGGSALPTLPAVATITAVVDDNGATVAQGAYTRDTTPQLQGTLAAPLSGAQTLAVSRNGTVIGNAVASGAGWTFSDGAAPQGTLVYTVRVLQGSAFGATSNTYTVRVDNVAPGATASITSLSDDIFGVIADGGFASDNTPALAGTLSAAPDAGDSVQVLRNGTLAGAALVSGTGWTFTEPNPLPAGTYSYQVRVSDSALNLGASSAARGFTLINGVAGASITAVLDDASASIATGSLTRDATPALSGTLTALLPTGHLVRVLRNGSSAGSASVSGTAWSFTDNAPQGAVSYTVRVEAGAVIGAESAAYAFSIDSVAPSQTVAVTLISDDFIGALPPGGSTADQTPTISGTLSPALGTGEELRLRRTQSGTGTVSNVTVTPRPTGTTWSYNEPSLLAAGTYTYQALVFDAAGNTGTLSSTLAVTVDLSALPLPGAAVTLATVNGVTASGGSVPLSNINTPTLAGTVQRTLNAGEVVRAYRNTTGVGNAAVTGAAWTYTNTTLADGSYAFFARVELAGNSAVFGASSGTVNASIDATAPTQTANVTLIADSFTGNLANGGNTADTTPTISGTLSAALGARETLQLLRNGVVVATPTVSVGLTWTFTDTLSVAATYVYTARVIDTAGNVSLIAGSSRSVVLVTNLVAVSSLAVQGNAVTLGAGAYTNDNTPTVLVTLGANLPAGHAVRVYRDNLSTPVAALATCAPNCSFTDSAIADGTHSYIVRTEAGTALGSTSSSVSFIVDATLPAQTVADFHATSNRTPYNNTVAASADSVLGSTSSDPRPRLVVYFTGGAPLASATGTTAAESLVFTRNGVGFSPTVTPCPAGSLPNTYCFLDTTQSSTLVTVVAYNGVTVTNTPSTAGLPAGPVTYTVKVVDAAGNQQASATAMSPTLTTDYVVCSQARATAGTAAHVNISQAAGTAPNCNGCHKGPNTGSTATGALVPAPQVTPEYWCRRPA